MLHCTISIGRFSIRAGGLLVVFVVAIQQDSLSIDVEHSHGCKVCHLSKSGLDF